MKIAIVGAGTMGAGIAQVFAQSGYQTVLFDIKQDAIERAEAGIKKNLNKAIEIGKSDETKRDEALSNLIFTADFNELKADFILEAILERLDLKIDLFTRLAEQNASDCIFATNTSSIPITQIAASIPNPERLVGVHFFNPAHIMKLVEIISGAHTSEQVRNQSFELIKSTGKVPVNAADAPGFIVNRVARHYYVEGLKALEEGVTDHAGIDRLMENFGFKMGPFRLMDLIGVETNFSVTKSMYDLFHQDPKFRPSRIQEKKVLAGHHGRKSGKGFYDYSK